jgi:hypothetical protein
VDLAFREEYWIKFCMKLVALISHDNYYIDKGRGSIHSVALSEPTGVRRILKGCVVL